LKVLSFRRMSVKDSKRLGPRPLSGRGFEHNTAWARYKGFGEKSALRALFGLPDRAGLILGRKNVGKIAGFQGSSCPTLEDGQIGWRRERNWNRTCSKWPAQFFRERGNSPNLSKTSTFYRDLRMRRSLRSQSCALHLFGSTDVGPDPTVGPRQPGAPLSDCLHKVWRKHRRPELAYSSGPQLLATTVRD
jgi:hypothetical protein